MKVRLRPFAYLLLLFIVDKLLLLPAIRQTVTLNPGLSYDLHDRPEMQIKSDRSRLQIWAFGSSRTVPFRRTSSATGSQLHVFAIPGSVPTVYLHQFLFLRESGERPDVVFIELSPFSVNRNYALRDAFLYETAPDAFIARHLTHYPFEYLQFWAGSRAFVSSVYPPGIYSAEQRALVQFLNPLENEGGSGPALTGKDIEERHSDENYVSLFRKVYLTGHLQNYSIDPVARRSLEALIQEIEREGIPYVIWNPPVHSRLLELYEEAGASGDFDGLLASLSSHGINMQEEIICATYSDESHLADECYAEIERLLLRHALNDARREP